MSKKIDENDEDSELIKCSGFICDKSAVERIFKIEDVLKEIDIK